MSVKVCFHWWFEEPDYYQWFVAKVHWNGQSLCRSLPNDVDLV